MDTLAIALPPGAARTSTTLASTISSDGRIRVYDLAAVPSNPGEPAELEPRAVYDSKGSRLTCMAMADGDAVGPVAGKRKRADDDEDEDADGWAPGTNPDGEISEEEDASEEGESGSEGEEEGEEEIEEEDEEEAEED